MMRLTAEQTRPDQQESSKTETRERPEHGLEIPNMRSYQLASLLLSYHAQESSRREE